MVRRPVPAGTGIRGRARPQAEPGRETRVVDIFDEVEEELRAERAQLLFKRYAGLILAVAVLIVAGAGGWEFWRWRQAKADQVAAQDYVAALSVQARPAAAAETKTLIADYAAIAKSAPEGYRTLARLQQAALEAKTGDLKAATTLWETVAADSDAEPLLRDLANLLWCQHLIDTGNPAVLEGRLKALAEPGNVWRPLAQEQLALLDIRQGKTDVAKAELNKLARDVTAPEGVRGRAAALLARLG